MKGFLRILGEILKGIGEGIKDRSVETIETELKDLEGAFGLLLFGSLMGLPVFSTYVAVSLLPYAEREIIALLARAFSLDDIAAYWFEIADI